MSKKTIKKYSFLTRLFLSIFNPKKLKELDEIVEVANEALDVIESVDEISSDVPDAYESLADKLDK